MTWNMNHLVVTKTQRVIDRDDTEYESFSSDEDKEGDDRNDTEYESFNEDNDDL